MYIYVCVLIYNVSYCHLLYIHICVLIHARKYAITINDSQHFTVSDVACLMEQPLPFRRHFMIVDNKSCIGCIVIHNTYV